MRKRTLAVVAAFVAVTGLCVFTGISSVLAATTPAGFTDSLVTPVESPTAMDFLPDGRMLIVTQPGQLYISGGGALGAPALDLSTKVCTDRERGLVGVGVDPLFVSTRAIYVYYTFNKSGTCPSGSSIDPVNRLSRFVLSESDVVDPASESVLIDNIPSTEGVHNGGDIQFDRDGLLYLTVGDSGCDPEGDSGCFGTNDAARSLNLLVGKILRITTSGAIPASNPYSGVGSTRCNVTGGAAPGTKCQEVVAYGLRNPWRLAFDPNGAQSRAFINDVGEQTWEEVNQLQIGADYGWNEREGSCEQGSTTACGPAPPGMTNPVASYQHQAGGCNAITGGAFVPSGLWPVEYEGRYLYSDYTCGKIFSLNPSTGTTTEFATNLGVGSAISMRFGPSGATSALYYATYVNGGEIRRIQYTGAGNRAPSASAVASPRWGPTPLAVTFSGSASSDPDGNALVYTWTFGDGTPSTQSASPTATHTYVNAGTYTATLVVTDTAGASSLPFALRIDAGNIAPTPSITRPLPSSRFRVGETIVLEGAATDPEEGAVPGARLSWRAVLHHDSHTHPFLQPTTGSTVSIVAPAPESLSAAATSYLEVFLTATDSTGLSQTVAQNVLPDTVQLTFTSDPSGVSLSLNGAATATPATRTSWNGYAFTAEAPAQTTVGGSTMTFQRWSDGVTQLRRTITTPGANTTFSAIYGGSPPPPLLASFDVTAGGDDGWVERGGAVYPPSVSDAASVDSAGALMAVRRSKPPYPYEPVATALVRFDTSSLPDNATITGATLVLMPTAVASTDGLSVVAGWYSPASWPIDAGDWTVGAPADAHAGTPMSSIVANQTLSLGLQNLTNVNRAGSTALRLHLSAQTPTGPNDLVIATSEDPNLPAPRLVVTYTTDTPPPPLTASFDVTVGSDDGWIDRGGPVYPPSAADPAYVDSAGAIMAVRRSKTPYPYQPVATSLVRFDTSSLPDNATITGATLVVMPTVRVSTDGLNLVAGWYSPGSWPIDAGDWTVAAPSDAHAGTPLASIVANQPLSLGLQNLTNVNRAGLTALRLHLSVQTPTGPNDLVIATSEDPNLPAPRLVVTYTTDAPPPPPPPLTASFDVTVGSDDGWIERGGPVYPPSVADPAYVDSAGAIMAVRRSKPPYPYEPVAMSLVRFDTSSLPDNAVITGATLVLMPTARASTDGLSLVAGWYSPASWPIDAGDWTVGAPADAHAGTPMASIMANQSLSLGLLNLSNINKAGLTALRLHLSAQTPTGPNDLVIATSEDPSLPAPRLIVTYTLN